MLENFPLALPAPALLPCLPAPIDPSRPLAAPVATATPVVSLGIPCTVATMETPLQAPAVDAVQLLLANKTSPQTRRAYAGDLRDFFGGDIGPATVAEFLSLPTTAIALRLAEYKAGMLAWGAAEATINRRLAAVRSLLKFAHRLGMCATSGADLVDGEKVQAYRDTSGIKLDQMKKLIKQPARLHGATSVRGLRDTALLRILCENALRRAEVCSLDVADFDFPAKRLQVRGKGKGTQKVPVTLSAKAAGALRAYLLTAGHTEGALFRNQHRDPASAGRRLTVDGLYHLIGAYGAAMGLQRLTPHGLRHSSITAALDATGGDVRRVQKLSRHARLETLQRYDDNRADFQGEVSHLLSGLL